MLKLVICNSWPLVLVDNLIFWFTVSCSNANKRVYIKLRKWHYIPNQTTYLPQIYKSQFEPKQQQKKMKKRRVKTTRHTWFPLRLTTRQTSNLSYYLWMIMTFILLWISFHILILGTTTEPSSLTKTKPNQNLNRNSKIKTKTDSREVILGGCPSSGLPYLETEEQCTP